MMMMMICRFCDLVNALTEEAWKGSEDAECESEALEVKYHPEIHLNLGFYSFLKYTVYYKFTVYICYIEF